MDFLVERRPVLELKAVETLLSIHNLRALIGLVNEVRSCIISPQGEIGALNAHLRVATIDGRVFKRSIHARTRGRGSSRCARPVLAISHTNGT